MWLAAGSPKADGIQDLVMAIMVDVLVRGNPECGKYYPLA